MDKINIQGKHLGKLFSLSPEYWLSLHSANTLEKGIVLSTLVTLQKTGTNKLTNEKLVLDTGNTDRGLFILPTVINGQRIQRISNKKRVPEGSVLISRLRPYLQQVCYVPHGMSALLGVSEILCSTEYYVLVSKNSEISIAYLVPWLLSRNIQRVFEQATTGGHHPRFNDDLLMHLTIPPNFIQKHEEISIQVEKLTLQNLHTQINMNTLISNHSLSDDNETELMPFFAKNSCNEI